MTPFAARNSSSGTAWPAARRCRPGGHSSRCLCAPGRDLLRYSGTHLAPAARLCFEGVEFPLQSFERAPQGLDLLLQFGDVVHALYSAASRSMPSM